MARKKYFEFIVKDKVQDVGLRLAIGKLVPDELDVRADNLPDASIRVVVRGLEQDVRKFWRNLQRTLLGKAENPGFSRLKDITGMSIDTNRFYHKLQCEQMEKFVDVGLDMKSSMDGMSGKIDKMSGKIDNMSGKIDNMSADIKDMTSTFTDMDAKLDTLPKNMAKEIVKLKKNGFL